MSYDVGSGTPRSVKIQRRIEDVVEPVRDWHLVLVGILSVIIYEAVFGDGVESAESSSAVAEFVSQITLVDIGIGVGLIVTGMIILNLITALHELCHVAALRLLGIRSDWYVDWFLIGRSRELQITGGSGVCIPRPQIRHHQMSYAENVFVGLAPLVLSGAVLGVMAIADLALGIGPGVDWILGLLVVVFTGPSVGDWVSILETPAYRWEYLIEIEEALDRQRASEGIGA